MQNWREKPYEFYGSAEEILYSKDRILIASGPAGTGKSRAILEKIHLFSCEFKNHRTLIVRKTRKSLTEAALYTFEEHVLPPGSSICAGAHRLNRSQYHYPNGSMIALVGLDDNSADQIMSTEFDLVYVQEGIEVDEEVIEKLDMRMRGYAGPCRQLIIDTNPGPPTHYLLKWSQEDKARMIHTRHEDNPRYYDRDAKTWTAEGDEYLGALRRKKGHLLDRYYFGKWVQPEGARWSCLDERVHGFTFAERFPQGMPTQYTKIIGGDWGIAKPFAALWFAIDYKKDVYMYRERYMTGLHASQQAKEVIKATGQNEYISRIRLDPQYWQKPPRNEEYKTDKSYYHHYSEVIKTDNRFGPIQKGFNESRALGEGFLDELFDHDNGGPNLFIETDLCPNAWAELTGATWSDKDRKEQMSDKNPDHAITATIYGLYGQLSAPVAPRKWPTPEEAREAATKEIVKASVNDFRKRTEGRQRNRVRF